MSQVEQTNEGHPGYAAAKPIISKDRDQAVAEANGVTSEPIMPTSVRGDESLNVSEAGDIETLSEINDGAVAKRPARTGGAFISVEQPELFRNLRTILLARDIGPNEKISAAKSLLHNYKNGSVIAATHAEAMLIEMLTHERMRGF